MGTASPSAPQSVAIRLDSQTPLTLTLGSDGPSLPANSGATVAVTATGTLATGLPYTKYAISMPLPTSGTAMNIKVTPHGFRSNLQTSLGIDNLAINLNTPPAQQFQTALPLDTSAPGLGNGAGSLETTSAQDDYTFHIADDDAALLLTTGGCATRHITLVDASGHVIDPDRTGCGDRGYTHLASGDYTLQVWGGTPGTYRVTLDYAPTAQTFAYSLGQKVTDGKIAGANTVGAGNLETSSSKDIYQFSVSASSQRVFFDGRGEACSDAHLLRVDHWEDIGPVCGGDYVLAHGDYEIRMGANGENPAGAYTLATYVVIDGQLPDIQVNTNNDTVDVPITTRQTRGMSFNATQGQRLVVNLLDSSYYNQNGVGYLFGVDGFVQITLTSPSGIVWQGWNWQGNPFQWSVESAEAGTYRVELESRSDSTEALTLLFADRSDRKLTAATDNSDNTFDLAPKQNAQITFTATHNHRYRVTIPASELSGDEQKLRITAPNGDVVVDDAPAWQDSAFYIEAAQAGVYKVLLDPVGESSGSTTLRVKDVTDLQITPATDGSNNTFALDPGQNAQFNINASGGHRYRVTIPASELSGDEQKLRITAPNGDVVVDDAPAWQDSAFYIEAAQAGVYKVLLDPVGESSGSTTLRVKDVTDLQITPATDGSNNTFALDPGQNAQFNINASGGHRYRVTIPASELSGDEQKLRITAPNGDVVVDDAPAWQDSAFYIEAAQAGVYKVLLDPVGESSGSTTLRVKDVTDLQITPATDGSNNTFALDPGQNAQFNINASGGHRYRVTIPASELSGDEQKLRITAPNGDVVVDDAPAWQDSAFYIEAAQAGVYKVLLDPVGESSGSTTLRVKDVTDLQITPATDGSNNTFALDPGQNAQFNINASGGHRYRVTIPASELSGDEQKLRITAPNGDVVVDDAPAWQDSAFYIEAAQAGVYKVLLDPVGESSGSTTLRVKDVTDLQITPATDGSNNTFALDPGQNAQLNINASGGHRYRVTIPASDIGYWDNTVRIVAPSGTTVVNENAGEGSSWTIEPALAGTYKVYVDPNGDNSGSVTVQVVDDGAVLGACRPERPKTTTLGRSRQQTPWCQG